MVITNETVTGNYTNFSIFISSSVMEQMKEYGDSSAIEQCGILTGINSDSMIVADEFRPVANIATVGNVDYYMSPQEFGEATKDTTLMSKKADKNFVAVWHTHPSCPAIPSTIDVDNAVHDVVYLIYSPLENVTRAFYYNEDDEKFDYVEMEWE